MSTKVSVTVVSFFVLLGLSNGASSADFFVEKLDSSKAEFGPLEGDIFGYDYVISMHGEIDIGDAAALKNAMVDHFYNGFELGVERRVFEIIANYYSRRTVVSFYSAEGGNLDEAIEISRIVREYSLSTILTSGETCKSACSIVFMAGTRGTGGSFSAFGADQPARNVDYPAVLEFHAPSIPPVATAISDDIFSSLNRKELAEVIDADLATNYRAAGQQIRRMIEVNPGFWPDGLLVEMLLARGVGEYRRLDTVGDAIDWSIGIPNLKPRIRNLNELAEAAYWVCFNRMPGSILSAKFVGLTEEAVWLRIFDHVGGNTDHFLDRDWAVLLKRTDEELVFEITLWPNIFDISDCKVEIVEAKQVVVIDGHKFDLSASDQIKAYPPTTQLAELVVSQEQ